MPLWGELRARKRKILLLVERLQMPKYNERSIMYWKMKMLDGRAKKSWDDYNNRSKHIEGGVWKLCYHSDDWISAEKKTFIQPQHHWPIKPFEKAESSPKVLFYVVSSLFSIKGSIQQLHVTTASAPFCAKKVLVARLSRRRKISFLNELLMVFIAWREISLSFAH